MSPERAVEIIESLVDGVHPLTGEVLPEDNICEEVGIWDALNCAIQVLNERIVAIQAIKNYRSQQSVKAKSPCPSAGHTAADEGSRQPAQADEETEKPRRKLPDNAGKPWLQEDDTALLTQYRSGIPVTELARQFKRTRGSIRARLVRLGMADYGQQIPEVYDGVDPIDKKDLLERYRQGESIAQLAERYGRSEKAIRIRLFYMGIGKDAPDILPHRGK